MASKARKSGATALKYARAWVQSIWPDAPTHEAKNAVAWIPGKAKNAPRRPISKAHDIWGVADLVLIPTGLQCILVQVTTQNEKRSTVADRKRKIESWVEAHYHRDQRQHFSIYIVAYVQRQGLRVWSWSWGRWGWVERDMVPLRRLRDVA